VIDNHAIVEALTVPRGDGTSVLVDLNVATVFVPVGVIVRTNMLGTCCASRYRRQTIRLCVGANALHE
jgi:hypothetical protein